VLIEVAFLTCRGR